MRLVVSACYLRHKVSLGQDADQASVLDDRKTINLALSQKPRSLDQRGIRFDDNDLGSHYVLDRQRVEKLPLGVLAIA